MTSSNEFVPAPVGGVTGTVKGLDMASGPDKSVPVAAPKKPRKPRPSDLTRKAERVAARKAKEKKVVKTTKTKDVKEEPANTPVETKTKKKTKRTKRAAGTRRAPKGIRALISPLRAQEKDLQRRLKAVQSLIVRARKLEG